MDTIPFSILSCTSYQPNYPPQALVTRANSGWHSARFCSYPQELVLQLSKGCHVKRLAITSHQSRISSKVDIFTTTSGSQFRYFGTFSFQNSPQGGRERKTFEVQLSSDVFRLVFSRPYQNKQNFFEQIAITEISFDSSRISYSLPKEQSRSQPERLREPVAGAQTARTAGRAGEDRFSEQVRKLQQEKQSAVQSEDFDEAKRLKEKLQKLYKVANVVRDLQQRKRQAISVQDYDQAKALKQQIERVKQNAAQRTPSAYKPSRVKSKQTLNSQVEEFSVIQTQILEQEEDQFEPEGEQQKPAYNAQDERMLPVHMSRKQLTEDQDQANKIPEQPEELTEEKQRELALFIQVFGKDVARKLGSKFWKYRLEGAVDAQNMMEKVNKEFPSLFFKAYLSLALSLQRETVFQLTFQGINLVFQVLKLSEKKDPIESLGLIEQIVIESIKKVGEINLKLKNQADRLLKSLSTSSLTNPSLIITHLIKPESLSDKSIITRIQLVQFLAKKGGLISLPILEFAIQKLMHKNIEVRKIASQLINKLQNENRDKFMSLKGSLPSLAQQILKQKLLKKSPSSNKL